MKNSEKDLSKMMKLFDELGIAYKTDTIIPNLIMSDKYIDILIIKNQWNKELYFKFEADTGKFISFDFFTDKDLLALDIIEYGKKEFKNIYRQVLNEKEIRE